MIGGIGSKTDLKEKLSLASTQYIELGLIALSGALTFDTKKMEDILNVAYLDGVSYYYIALN